MIGWAVWIWFGVGMVNGELAVSLIGAQLVFIAVWIAILGVDTAASPGLVALYCGMAVVGIALRDGFDAGAAFSRALTMALGRDYLAAIPPLAEKVTTAYS